MIVRNHSRPGRLAQDVLKPKRLAFFVISRPVIRSIWLANPAAEVAKENQRGWWAEGAFKKAWKFVRTVLFGQGKKECAASLGAKNHIRLLVLIGLVDVVRGFDLGAGVQPDPQVAEFDVVIAEGGGGFALGGCGCFARQGSPDGLLTHSGLSCQTKAATEHSRQPDKLSSRQVNPTAVQSVRYVGVVQAFGKATS